MDEMRFWQKGVYESDKVDELMEEERRGPDWGFMFVWHGAPTLACQSSSAAEVRRGVVWKPDT